VDNKKRLIDANALMKYTQNQILRSIDCNDIARFPTVDAVEVVRCKDCKRCYEKRTRKNKQFMRFCMRMDGNEFQVNANDFCSYGERKEP
jgi:hypothetical protein